MPSNIPEGMECIGCGNVHHMCECPTYSNMQHEMDEDEYMEYMRND